MKKILVIGGGFAGLWSAVAAARRLQETDSEAQVTLLNRDAYHGIRVRYYEEDLSDTLVPLTQVLDPVGIKLVIGEVTGIDTVQQRVDVLIDDVPQALFYDKLVMASGSQLALPAIPGLAEHAFNIDTHAAAMRLQTHMRQLAVAPQRAGWLSAVVVGAGATGVELACELPERLRNAAAASGRPNADRDVRVILADREKIVCSQLGEARTVIERACDTLGVERLPNVAIKAIGADGVVLANGTIIPAATVVWCAGMRASSLNSYISAELDPSGRLYVDEHLKVKGLANVFAAGDAAHMLIDGKTPSVMSCQHSRPMGRFAGHNVVNELLGKPLEPLNIDWYTNIIDLGSWGAVYAEGQARTVRSEGEAAKKTKTIINRERIYPPLSGNKDAILAASALDLQRPPAMNSQP